jgi:hypothetical protein
MKKTMVTLFILAALMFMSVRPVFADATIGIQGGTLSFTTEAITFTGVTLDGTTQEGIAGETGQWEVSDPTGTGSGWKVTVEADDFKEDSAPTKIIAAHNITMILLPEHLANLEETGYPNNALPVIEGTFDEEYLSIGSQQILLVAAADTGMGTYGFSPDFQLTVPASTYMGDYTSIITVTLTAGP